MVQMIIMCIEDSGKWDNKALAPQLAGFHFSEVPIPRRTASSLSSFCAIVLWTFPSLQPNFSLRCPFPTHLRAFTG